MGGTLQDFFELCERVNDLIQIVSPSGNFLYVNRAWSEALGYSAEEAVDSLRMGQILGEQDLSRWDDLIHKLRPEAPAARLQIALRAKDSRQIQVDGESTCRFEDGQPLAIRSIFHVSGAVGESREELQSLFDLSLDLLCVAGTDSYFKQINPAFERALGYSKEELLRRSFLEFVHPDDRASTVREVERLAQGFPVVDFQNRYQAKDGSYRWLAWRSAPRPERGLIYAVARDITEQKRTERLLARRTAELERSNRDLEEFASVASHDLRAPLRAIIHLAEWIEEDMPGEMPEDIQDKLRKLRHQVQRMQTLTDDLLAYARAGREASAATEVDTAQLIREVIAFLQVPETFQIELGPDLPVFHTFKAPLEQVLRNLISNAVKHHDRDGGRIAIQVTEGRDVYEFRVSDDGPGIPPESQEQVFRMFQRLQPGASVEGSGLGLSLVKRIVESCGGRIQVESEGRGTTFTFTWPKQAASSETEGTREAS